MNSSWVKSGIGVWQRRRSGTKLMRNGRSARSATTGLGHWISAFRDGQN
jgi:hypothetical protein